MTHEPNETEALLENELVGITAKIVAEVSLAKAIGLTASSLLALIEFAGSRDGFDHRKEILLKPSSDGRGIIICATEVTA